MEVSSCAIDFRGAAAVHPPIQEILAFALALIFYTVTRVRLGERPARVGIGCRRDADFRGKAENTGRIIFRSFNAQKKPRRRSVISAILLSSPLSFFVATGCKVITAKVFLCLPPGARGALFHWKRG